LRATKSTRATSAAGRRTETISFSFPVMGW
jgi:hypothetical protein